MEKLGIAIPKTILLIKTDQDWEQNLRLFFDRNVSKEIISKPVIGATAVDVLKITKESLEEDVIKIGKTLDRCAVLIQEFIPEIMEPGEYSYVLIDGDFR